MVMDESVQTPNFVQTRRTLHSSEETELCQAENVHKMMLSHKKMG